MIGPIGIKRGDHVQLSVVEINDRKSKLHPTQILPDSPGFSPNSFPLMGVKLVSSKDRTDRPCHKECALPNERKPLLNNNPELLISAGANYYYPSDKKVACNAFSC